MKKTILLVFIHGFKGGDDTFAGFPAHLRALVSHVLPKVNVLTATYPQFETRGDLRECVGKFREWLQNTVIDIEVANETPSPTVDPSVHVFLIGHSMGGIVGAETLLLLASEQLIPPPSNLSSSKSSAADHGQKQPVEANNFMFPHVQGLMAFDTPFLGIAPGVVSYTAETHYKTATSAYGALSEVAGVFGWGAAGNKTGTTKSANSPAENNNDDKRSAPQILPSTPDGASASTVDAAATPSWQRWGRYAMYAGAAGAVAAGGAAALYSQREKFLTGWTWATSHLEFVGCLARPEDLRHRLSAIGDLMNERGIGCADFYTCLGRGAVSVTSSSDVKNEPVSLNRNILRSKIRTFCNLPKDVDFEENGKVVGEEEEDGDAAMPHFTSGIRWIRAVNDVAADETKAHMSMFIPRENPAFYELATEACGVLTRWVDKGWYASSGSSNDGTSDRRSSSTPSRAATQKSPAGGQMGADKEGFMDADDVVVVD
ncbi:hypothetical protein AJ80_05909 [Polytolypa hystricis UAMH7299]|uniref:DUF676 domain-containing protein n=1 Tax=Polytolypa hystricis (strain UAMH7299) TaxID=1447883 RepID=A0A2B7XRS4_POLH7|nr:hypothetical protein AJ80_05909 [Polytolypa hystricis UAMH7299]